MQICFLGRGATYVSTLMLVGVIATDRCGIFMQLCNSEKGEYTFWEVRVRMCYACLRIECVSS